MRIITYGAAVSLDGFLAGPGGSIDWLRFSKDVQQVMTEYWKDVDTILMGRKTWEFAESQRRSQPAVAGMLSLRTHVFSRTLTSIHAPDVELVRTDAVEYVRNLKQQPGRQISLMSGSELAQALLAAGLLDEIRLNIHPILLGSGIPVFRGPAFRVHLELKDCRQIEHGCILTTHRVVH